MLFYKLDAWSFNENTPELMAVLCPALMQLQNTPTVKNSVNCAKNQPCSSSSLVPRPGKEEEKGPFAPLGFSCSRMSLQWF